MDDALSRLPHGAAFRFVDALDELVPGRRAVGCYRLRGDEAFLDGHFPGRPMLPGVIMLEMIAQLAGVCAQSDPAHAPMDDLRLAGVGRARIEGTAGPGSDLVVRAEIVGRMGTLVQASGEVCCGDRRLARAEITLAGL